jgi:hypothetical protein
MLLIEPQPSMMTREFSYIKHHLFINFLSRTLLSPRSKIDAGPNFNLGTKLSIGHTARQKRKKFHPQSQSSNHFFESRTSILQPPNITQWLSKSIPKASQLQLLLRHPRTQSQIPASPPSPPTLAFDCPPKNILVRRSTNAFRAC